MTLITLQEKEKNQQDRYANNHHVYSAISSDQGVDGVVDGYETAKGSYADGFFPGRGN